MSDGSNAGGPHDDLFPLIYGGLLLLLTFVSGGLAP